MIKKLEQKRKQILKKMGEITTLRLGSLTEQYIMRGKGSKRHRLGPYYIRTWYEDGGKRTEHVNAHEVRDMQTHIKNYRKMRELFDELLDVIEQQTIQA